MGTWGLQALRKELQVHRLGRQARPRVRGAQAPPGTTGPGDADAGRDRWGPQSAAARSPRAAAPEHDFRGQHGRTKASVSLHVGTVSLDKAGRDLPHCAAWPVFAGSETGQVPSPSSPACPPPTCRTHVHGRAVWPHVVGGAARCISANHWAFLKLGKWQVGREVRGLFCVKGHIVSISFLTESLATVGTRKRP